MGPVLAACTWVNSQIPDWAYHPLLIFSIDHEYLYCQFPPRCDNNHMDFGGSFLNLWEFECNGTVCDHYHQTAHSQRLNIPSLFQYLRPSVMYFSFLWVINYSSRKQSSILTKTPTSLTILHLFCQRDYLFIIVFPYILGTCRRHSPIFDLLNEWNSDYCGYLCLGFFINDVICYNFLFLLPVPFHIQLSTLSKHCRLRVKRNQFEEPFEGHGNHFPVS